MSHRCFASLGVLVVVIAVVSLAAVPVAGQVSSAAAKTKVAVAARAWTPPRTPDGQPDLQGVWANNTATPLERPKALAGKAFLTDQELAALKQRASKLFSGDGDAAFGDSVFEAALADAQKFSSRDVQTGDYNQFWLVDREWDHRTSLVVDPPDGRIPPLTPDAQKRRATAAAARGRPAEGPEDRSLSERCITFGAPRLGAGYNSYYQIVQAPGYVVMLMETIHDARVIPLDGRPHLSQNTRLWHGDSRGHWEGNTLVVDTTNYSATGGFMGSTENLHVVERFTRVSPGTINYEVTADDPATWTKPWTAMIPLRQSEDQLYEYACHEGNVALMSILAGARAEEKAADQAAKK